ncbi:hypothetical protein A33M_0251 [Rhodovulum sp. PH10]|uniref:PAS domain-containing protein n=1 Tax=Rhodovulum sp. PH10 TaxID=1187851 RepID=UPI00027C23E6|nr:PAS domain-containing protein [Rhodovulum sp. PH10]EJW10314.1 hypothetical protein A33M_0251 [Rhodovulum sp. PH10]
MKHPSSRELFQYWTALRGHRPAPERDEVDPGALRKVLGDSFVLTYDSRNGHPFRLAGTRLCGLFCRELKGASFLDLWDGASRPMAESLVEGVADEVSGMVVGVLAETATEPPLPLELLLLPLAHRMSVHARMIGVLAPLQTPYWIGIEPVQRLGLGTFRNLSPRIAPSLVPTIPERRGRPALVVLEGGRTD